MNRCLALVGAVALLVGSAASPQDSKPGSKPQEAPAGKSDEKADTPLAQQMAKLEKSMDALKRAVRDPTKRDLSLTEVANAQQACLASKLLTPKMTPTLPEPDRAAFVRDYRKGMASMLIELTNLEVALLDGDTDKSIAIYKKLAEMEDEGHTRFTNE